MSTRHQAITWANVDQDLWCHMAPLVHSELVNLGPNGSNNAVAKYLLEWKCFYSWWRHQMETFSALLTLCVGNSPVTGEFPSQRPVTRSFDVFFDLRLNKRLSKQSCSWWFETLWRSLWRHRNVLIRFYEIYFECYNWWWVGIGSGNGLVPSRKQATT